MINPDLTRLSLIVVDVSQAVAIRIVAASPELPSLQLPFLLHAPEHGATAFGARGCPGGRSDLATRFDTLLSEVFGKSSLLLEITELSQEHRSEHRIDFQAQHHHAVGSVGGASMLQEAIKT